MMDNPSFESPFVWLLTNPLIVKFSVGSLTAFCVLIAVLFILRKWGEN